ncbi:hypothetical protein BOX15_Mlig019159g3, partial [Macrostomum lignano]
WQLKRGWRQSYITLGFLFFGFSQAIVLPTILSTRQNRASNCKEMTLAKLTLVLVIAAVMLQMAPAAPSGGGSRGPGGSGGGGGGGGSGPRPGGGGPPPASGGSSAGSEERVRIAIPQLPEK